MVIEAESFCHLVTLNKINIHNTSCVLTCGYYTPYLYTSNTTGMNHLQQFLTFEILYFVHKRVTVLLQRFLQQTGMFSRRNIRRFISLLDAQRVPSETRACSSLSILFANYCHIFPLAL